jgi:hypothetical protein
MPGTSPGMTEEKVAQVDPKIILHHDSGTEAT